MTVRNSASMVRLLSALVASVLCATTFLFTAHAEAQGEPGTPGDVVISEIFYNPDGQEEGHEFIELHNTTAESIEVSGWQVSSGIEFTFPAGASIEANSYVVLSQNAIAFETVFGFAPTGDFSGSLSNGGETLTVQDATGAVMDQVTYDDVAPWPLSADGDGDSLVAVDTSLAPADPARWVAGMPTPQVANDPVLTVLFSVQRGWYSGGLSVTLTPSVAGASIVYNTDGSGVATTPYTGPITLTSVADVAVIQALATESGEASNLVTHSYVFKADAGIPVVATWPNGLAVAPGENEVTRSFEFIPPPSTGLAATWANSGVKASEGGIAAGESDKFFFRGSYGNSTLTGDLFGDNYYGLEPTTSIDQLFLRNLQGDATHLRQILAHDSLLELGQLSPHGRFVSYYKDGTDSGPRHMQERPEGGFMESYTDIDKDQWLAWSTNETTPGSGTPNGLGGETMGAPFGSWAQATNAINVESLIDYLLVQWQAKVSDYRNIKNFRTAGPVNFANGDGGDYRYHFFNWDMDLGYSNNQYNRGGPAGWGWAGYTSPDYIAHDLDGFVEFRLLASDRISCAFAPGGPLTQEAFTPRLEARHQELIAAGGAAQTTFVNGLGTWIGQRNTWLLDEFRSPGADTTVFGSFRPDRPPWKPTSDFTGPLLQSAEAVDVIVADGVLSISNSNNGQVYYRLDGGDPRNSDGSLSPDAIAYNGPASLPTGRVEIIARSFDANESDTFQAWSPACNQASTYDIAVSGNPGASPGEGLVITEINYNPLPRPGSGVPPELAEFLEIHNTTNQPINVSDFRFNAGIDFVFPTGTSIAAGEYAVLVPEGAGIAYSVEYDIGNGAPPAPFGEFGGRLGDGGETLTLIDAVGGLVDTVTYDDMAPWPTEADGLGPALALRDPVLDNDLADSWTTALTTGTPGAANTVTLGGDVNCNGQLSVADAVVVAQFTVGLRAGQQTCMLFDAIDEIYLPAADLNDTGTITVADAVIIAQCTVGVSNPFCP